VPICFVGLSTLRLYWHISCFRAIFRHCLNSDDNYFTRCNIRNRSLQARGSTIVMIGLHQNLQNDYVLCGYWLWKTVPYRGPHISHSADWSGQIKHSDMGPRVQSSTNCVNLGVKIWGRFWQFLAVWDFAAWRICITAIVTNTAHCTSAARHQHVISYDTCSAQVASLVEWTGDARASSHVMTAANINTIQRSAAQHSTGQAQSQSHYNALIAYRGTCPPSCTPLPVPPVLLLLQY